MDENEKSLGKPNLYKEANVLQTLFFCWLTPILKKGFKRKLGPDDFFIPPKKDQALTVYQHLQQSWEKELLKETEFHKPSLRRAIWNIIWKKLLIYGSIYFSKFYILGAVNVAAMGLIIRTIESGKTGGSEIYLYASIVIGTFGFGLLMIHQMIFFVERLGMRMRLSCCSMVYRKALRLSKALMATTTAGKFFNIVAGDVLRFDQLTLYCLSIWIEPFASVLVLAYLYFMYGLPVLPGVGILYFNAIIQVLQGRIFTKLRLKKSMATDERLKIINGILSDMKAIKMYSWEIPFANLIKQIRKQELKVIAATMALRTFNMMVYISGSKLPLFLAIFTALYIGQEIRAEMVFVTYALYNILKLNLMYIFPNGVQKVAEVFVSIGRLQTILLMEEKKQTTSIRHLESFKHEGNSLVINDLTAAWGKEDSRFQLNGISLSLSNGALCFVTGSVGSGKSSLLLAILGEMLHKNGNATVKGRIAYVAQESWLFPATIRKNIVFSLPFDEKRYRQVLEACALMEDLNNFPEGDSSQVGDKGVTLSGGQKARIHLARAMYHDADVYLMDDCLSAVDARVGNHLFRSCINGLVKSSLRVLVTHQLQHITPDSHVVVMKNGKIVKQGDYNAIKNVENKDKSEDTSNSLDILSQGTFSLDSMDMEGIQANEPDEEKDNSKDLSKSKDYLEEGYLVGVSLKGYMTYFKSAHTYFTMFLFVIVNFAAQIISISYELWLVKWTQAEAEYDPSKFESISSNATFKNESAIPTFNPNVYLRIFSYDLTSSYDAFTVFSYITIALLLVTLVRTVMFFAFTLKASAVIHKRLISAVLKSKMSFFNINPLGRIINRFAKDMESIDDILPPALYDEIVEMSTLLEVVAIVIYVDYWLGIPSFFLACFFILICTCYWRTSSVIKRIEAVKRSPVFTLMSNSIQGQVTIRAHKAEAVLSKEFDGHQDSHTTAWFLFLGLTRWFAIWMETLVLAFITIILLSMITVEGRFTGSEIGLLVTLVTRLSSTLQWGIKQAAETETQITSVERVSEYSNLPAEDGYDREMPETVIKEWPKYGQIKFTNVSLSYSPRDPPVLKGLNFTIKPGEKIGIVGRTGAGKSSLITAMFRLSDVEGDIEIDGVNTNAVPLPSLRKAFSIIPQDPVLFVGTIRHNLDPFSERTDDVLWQALEDVQIKEIVQGMDKGLNAAVSEGGSNFSVGQRQLLCLSRAILRNSKIILLDEATSNIDKTSDEIVQNVLRKRFNNCTILIIAHRLDTIMDVDKVMVMHEGQLIEFDEPFALLQQEETAFSKLVNQTGKVASSRLMHIAQMHHLYVRNLSQDSPKSGM